MTNVRVIDKERTEEQIRERASQILTEIIDRALRDGTGQASFGSALFQHALSSLVEALLSGCRSQAGLLQDPKKGRLQQHVHKEIGVLGPEQIGRVYEYLRGFELDPQSGTTAKLVPSVKTKRNLGLFYTPPQIVRHIVESSLDALRTQRPGDYLDIRVLDPAAGTGAFLAETLDQLAARILGGFDGKTRERIEQVRAHYRGAVFGKGLDVVPDEGTAVRIFLLEHCLYGVDLDPIAVRIAKAVLLDRAFRQLDVTSGLEPRVRAGNTLVGTGNSESGVLERGREDFHHAGLYFGKPPPDRSEINEWVASDRVFHWPIEFPEIFSKDRRGFDVVVGNPPYEIVSVKESGVREKSRDQAYFRKTYRTCQGKINTYRLMTERGLSLLREGGTIGFIVPATLLCDSTAAKLRQLVLQESRVLEAVVIPERAQVFEGVTQALLILVAEKGRTTDAISPVFWYGSGPIPRHGEVRISRELIRRTSQRVPLLRSFNEKRLLERLMEYPPLKGTEEIAAAGFVHQGEINISVHREFITTEPTDFPLVRGEHVAPFHLIHPSRRGRRLDWVLPAFFQKDEKPDGRSAGQGDPAARPQQDGVTRLDSWRRRRIVLGRAVNMQTDRRLKAAAAPSGTFLGDMTNFISDAAVPFNYLIGLLNSRLFDWRIKVTSTNNYVSAREIEGLPIPRIPSAPIPQEIVSAARDWLGPLLEDPRGSVSECCEEARNDLASEIRLCGSALLPMMIGQLSEAIQVASVEEMGRRWTGLVNLLDALVLLLYGVESYSAALWEG